MELKELEIKFSVCQIETIEAVDFTQAYVFLSKTDDELSLVCETTRVPEKVIQVEHGWRALKITGVLDFGMIGVIANISKILAEASISLFVVSTYNTDYILVKENTYTEVIKVLKENKYTFC